MKAADSRRFFNVEQVPSSQLDALLSATELEGHRLIHLRVERLAGTAAYVYTPFFKRGAAHARKTARKRKGR
jgi:hypothetical protein